MSRPEHIAFLPAREGSVGFPGKNRLFFDAAAEFVIMSGLFDRVIVSTNDEVVKEKAQARAFSIHHRNEFLCGPAVSMKQVAQNMIKEMNIPGHDYIWLIFIPVLYRNVDDFIEAKKLIGEQKIESLCSFIKAKVHPYDCWKFNGENKKLEQFVKNDTFRRQDKPPAWQHYHYLSCFKAEIIDSLNHELIKSDTHPVFLNKVTAKKLIEIDSPQDYEEWQGQQNAEPTTSH